MKKYMWVASSNDNCFDIKSDKTFANKRDCYLDMRNAALEKMKWNTEYEDFDSDDDKSYIGYDVQFHPNKIIHTSYSGVYTYNIVEIMVVTIEIAADDLKNIKPYGKILDIKN